MDLAERLGIRRRLLRNNSGTETADPLKLSGKIDRRDFGLTWNQALETGGVVVGNDIKISIEVEAVKA